MPDLSVPGMMPALPLLTLPPDTCCLSKQPAMRTLLVSVSSCHTRPCQRGSWITCSVGRRAQQASNQRPCFCMHVHPQAASLRKPRSTFSLAMHLASH